MRKLSKYLWFNWRITVQAIRAILARIKWKKSLLLEKLVQDKINCSICIYILSREYMCLWLQAAWATPPIHWIMLCCMLVKFWTACRILHAYSFASHICSRLLHRTSLQSMAAIQAMPSCSTAQPLDHRYLLFLNLLLCPSSPSPPFIF